MNHPHLPADVASDVDVERIKERIRREPFVSFDRERLIRRMMLFGVVCGVTGGAWWCASYLESYVTFSGGAPLTTEVIVEAIIVALFGGVLIGGAGGLGLALLTLGFISFFRPVYVALFSSPEEFERQYSDKSPRIR